MGEGRWSGQAPGPTLISDQLGELEIRDKLLNRLRTYLSRSAPQMAGLDARVRTAGWCRKFHHQY